MILFSLSWQILGSACVEPFMLRLINCLVLGFTILEDEIVVADAVAAVYD